ncbi:VacJ family lipoprotein [Polaromonas sp. YR568]|uniref:MlaA family lipoprotein n=1 Tax=Polaromonas sp. YR568 TaxID=1855301 RepID=UPI00398BC0A0
MTSNNTMKKSTGWAGAAVLAVALLQGCATGPGANPTDPLEPFNRAMFGFNEGVDRAVLKPVATVYRDVTPQPVRTGVTSFFGNISDVWAIVNNLLQGKGEFAADSLARVTTNTLWGLGGIFDVATGLKIPKHSEDFGQTLGVWGVGSGPYLVLPLLGPSTVRDTAGLLVDSQLDLVTQASNVRVRNSLSTLRVVNVRANLLGAGDVLDQAALDKYSFTREIYQQRRSSLIGNAPVEKEERFDLPEGATATPAPAAK